MTTSKAAISKHPLHPMIVPFPIAFLVGALATDITYKSTLNPMWADFSKWLLLAGIVMGAFAAVLGLIDFTGIKRARSATGWVHMAGNVLVMALSVISLMLRWNAPVDGLESGGFVLSIIVSLLLVGTGWLGGELAYRHRVGVVDEPERGQTLHPAE